MDALRDTTASHYEDCLGAATLLRKNEKNEIPSFFSKSQVGNEVLPSRESAKSSLLKEKNIGKGCDQTSGACLDPLSKHNDRPPHATNKLINPRLVEGAATETIRNGATVNTGFFPLSTPSFALSDHEKASDNDNNDCRFIMNMTGRADDDVSNDKPHHIFDNLNEIIELSEDNATKKDPFESSSSANKEGLTDNSLIVAFDKNIEIVVSDEEIDTGIATVPTQGYSPPQLNTSQAIPHEITRGYWEKYLEQQKRIEQKNFNNVKREALEFDSKMEPLHGLLHLDEKVLFLRLSRSGLAFQRTNPSAISELSEHSGFITGCALLGAEDNSLVAVSSSGKLFVYKHRPHSFVCIKEFDLGPGFISCLSVYKDTIFCGSQDGQVISLQRFTTFFVSDPLVIGRQTVAVTHVYVKCLFRLPWLLDNVVVGYFNGVIDSFDGAGNLFWSHTVSAIGAPISALFVSESLILGGTEDGVIYSLENSTGKLKKLYTHHEPRKPIHSIRVIDSTLYSCSSDATLQLVSLETADVLRILVGRGPVTSFHIEKVLNDENRVTLYFGGRTKEVEAVYGYLEKATFAISAPSLQCYWVNCQTANKCSFVGPRDLAEHVNLHSRKLKEATSAPFTCGFGPCRLSFLDYKSFEDHLIAHTGGFSCSAGCVNFIAGSRESLTSHYSAHHNFACTYNKEFVCRKVLNSDLELRLHSVKHKGGLCKYCFTVNENFHQEQLHEKFHLINGYRCSECAEVFSSGEAFLEHRNSHKTCTQSKGRENPSSIQADQPPLKKKTTRKAEGQRPLRPKPTSSRPGIPDDQKISSAETLRLLKSSDPYYILGVNKAAPFSIIKKQYHRLCLKWHPDRCLNDKEEQTLKFQKIAWAYMQLKKTKF
ncbi:uncharacterized protein LOC135121179 [Zophobas morio]|uniref:uncharacterized protein LOC135121179 n=1 Tax=Zophobas morio TaxID=2755281 RepID=UPI003083DEF8